MPLHEIRQLYGEVYVTIFPDGFTVPWKPLTIGEYIRYTLDEKRGHIPGPVLEDEIFRKCVLDKAIVRNMAFHKAGTITTVVRNILDHSGANHIDVLNHDVDSARAMLMMPGVRAYHDMVMLITTAFPYKPEELYAMDYETFMMRFAMAERKLLEAGAIKQPLVFEDVNKKKTRKRKTDRRIEEFIQEEQKPKVDAKKLWEKQEVRKKISKTPLHLPEEENPPDKRKWWNVSPILEAPSAHDIDFKTESQEQTVFGMTGHEQQDAHIERAKMLEDAMVIYKDVIEALEKKRAKK